MASKPDYIVSLRSAIRQLHGCESVWLKTVPVVEKFGHKTIWNGDVEVFSLFGHPKAIHAYAWVEPAKAEPRFVAVLEIPPVHDARTAVQASIMADSKTGQS